MTNTNRLIWITVFAVVSHCMFSTEACSCAPASMQHRNVGCKDEFMAVVNVTDEEVVSMYREYWFKLIQDNTEQLADHRSIDSFNKIITGIYGAVCGIGLHLNHTYLLKGSFTNELHIALCSSYVRELTHVPTQTEAKEMFAEVYKQVC